MGKFDYIPGALEELSVTKLFHKVQQRPGKPFWFGAHSNGVLVFALPGNPVSAYTCLHRYVLPALAQGSGLCVAAPRLVALAQSVTFKAPLAYFLPVRLSSGPGAELLATPAATNTSGDFAGLVDSDGFIELPGEQAEFPAGFIARYWPWV